MTNAVVTTDADILVLGGGSAGAMAAAWAKVSDPTQRVVVFEKGDIKYSGCIARGMDALNVVAVPGVATPEDYVESVRATCDGLINDIPSHTMASRTWALVKTLESWGVFFPRDEDGDYEILKNHPKGRFTLSMLEPDLKVKLAHQVAQRGCRVFNRVMAVELLVDDGRVAGAIGINVRTGEVVVCRAKAVIVSAGGAARFGLPNSGHLYGGFDFPGNTGDGYMLAYRAGARLTGFEHTMRACIVKDVNIPLLWIVITRGARFLDALDEDITDAGPIISSLVQRHERGLGPTHIRMSHLPEDRIRDIERILFTVERPAQQRFYEGRGIDFRRDDIELWPTDYYLCGGHGMTGVVVNDRAETAVPGLYAAGDSACVPYQYLSGAFVFGQVAAENAAAYARSQPPPRINEEQVRAVKNRLSGIESLKGRIGVDEFEYKARRLITDYVTPPKNAYKLNQWMAWSNRLTADLGEVVGVRGVHDVFKFLEVENIIGCAAVSASAALERRESRWGSYHYRSDYPERDDANWLKHIDCCRGESDLDIRISHRAVERMEVRS